METAKPDRPSDAVDPELAQLRLDNINLKKQLARYENIQKEIAAQEIYESAKKKLNIWLTVGGVTTLVVGTFGFNQLKGYIQTEVQQRLEHGIDAAMTVAIQRQISDDLTRKQSYILSTLNDKIAQFVLSQPLSAVQSTSGQAPSTSNAYDPKRTVLDYSPQMSPIRDMGAEGSVVGFALSAALEYQIYKKTGSRVVLSARDLYYISRKIQGSVQTDSGATISDGVKALTTNGVVAESVWPYKAGEFAAAPPPQVSTAQKFRISNPRKVPATIEAMKAALQTVGPIVTGIALYSGAETADAARTGVIPDPAANEPIVGGHAICIVGYDDVRKRIKFRNSWGAGWGDHGYGYLSYAYYAKLSNDAWQFES